MPNRELPRGSPVRRAARRPDAAPRPAQPAPPPKPDALPPQVRAPNRTEWPDPLNAAERAALEAGWSFVE